MSQRPDYDQSVRVSIGFDVYDLASRTLVLASVDGPGDVIGQAATAIDDGADIVEVATIDDVAALHEKFDSAISLLCRDAAVDVAAAVKAGTSMIDDRRGVLDADVISVAARENAALVLSFAACAAPVDACDAIAAQANRAETAGINVNRIIIDGGLDAPRSPADRDALLQSTHRMASLG